MTDLEKARVLINEVDSEMARLFEKRMDAVRSVADYKKKNGLPIDDLSREEEIIKRNADLISSEEYRSYYIDFMKKVINLSKDMQHRLIDGEM